MEEDKRDSPWNFHTCNYCTYQSKSAFLMYKHVRLHRTKPKSDVFLCDSKTPELFECEFCDFFTDMKVKLYEHFRVFHEEEEPNSELVEILKYFRCRRCDFTTHSMLVLARHTDDCYKGSSKLSSPKDISSESARETNGKVRMKVRNKFAKKSGDALQGKQKEVGSPRKEKSKRHCCCFCSQLVTVLPRHLLGVHKDEPEIIRILTLPFSDKVAEMKKLRFRGDKAYNKKVKLDKRITVRTPLFDKITRFVECPHCGALYGKKNFDRHKRKCLGNRSPESYSGSPSERPVLQNIRKQHSESISKVQKRAKNPEKSMTPKRSTVKAERGLGEEAARNRKNCKRHCCCYCSKLMTTVGRHLKSVHKDEPEIIRILTLPPSDRLKELYKLRNRGDKMYNERVKPEKRILVRKPICSQTFQSTECSNCSALIGKKNFYRHAKKCFGKLFKRRRVVFQSADISENSALKQLFAKMSDDEIGRTAANDNTIKLMGIHCLNKSYSGKHFLLMIRSQMRNCARVLLEVKKLDPTINEMKDCITPEKYAVIMDAIKNICQFDGTKFQVPTVALQFRTSLNHICAALKLEYSKHGPVSDAQIKSLDEFAALHGSKFRIIGRTIEYGVVGCVEI